MRQRMQFRERLARYSSCELTHAMGSSPVSSPHYSIVPAEKGWVLIIENEHCCVMQVFSSAAAARHAVDRMLQFFDTMSTHAPAARRVA